MTRQSGQVDKFPTVLGATDSGHNVTNQLQNGCNIYRDTMDLKTRRWTRACQQLVSHSLVDTIVGVLSEILQKSPRDVTHSPDDGCESGWSGLSP